MAILNHRRTTRARFSLGDEHMNASDTVLAIDTVTELANLAMDPLTYPLDRNVWLPPSEEEEKNAIIYIRELVFPVQALVKYLPRHREERPRDDPWIEGIETELLAMGENVKYQRH
jgi:hypothetical protein